MYLNRATDAGDSWWINIRTIRTDGRIVNGWGRYLFSTSKSSLHRMGVNGQTLESVDVRLVFYDANGNVQGDASVKMTGEAQSNRPGSGIQNEVTAHVVGAV